MKKIVYVVENIDFKENPNRWFVDYAEEVDEVVKVKHQEFDNKSEAMVYKTDLNRVLGKELLPMPNY